MELGAVTGAHYTGEPARQKQEKAASAAQKSKNPAMDYIRISREAQQAQREKVRETIDSDWIKEQIRNSEAQAEATNKEFKKMNNCQRISARIMAGDKVSPEDERYLMEHDPKMYQLSMAMRRVKPDPKEWERITDDEDEEGGPTEGASAASSSEGGSGDGSTPEVSAPEAAAGAE